MQGSEGKQVFSYTRRAIDDYQMIEEGDKIAVGISGGKDSLTLLYALHGLRRFYPKHFDIHAVTVDLGFHNDCSGCRHYHGRSALALRKRLLRLQKGKKGAQKNVRL